MSYVSIGDEHGFESGALEIGNPLKVSFYWFHLELGVDGWMHVILMQAIKLTKKNKIRHCRGLDFLQKIT